MFRKNLYVRLAAHAVRYRVPMIVRQVYRDNEGFFNSLCPNCRRTIPWEYMSFCSACGQRLSWIFLDEAEELSLPIDETGMQGETKLHFLLRSSIQRLSFSMKHESDCGNSSIEPHDIQSALDNDDEWATS